MVANVATLVDRAHREQVPVVWVQHSDKHLERGSDNWHIVPELTPDTEPLVEKNYGDSFEDTTLESVLAGLGVGRLVVVGAQTGACIRSTLHGALARGYDATLVSDAHTTRDESPWGAPPPDQVIAHTNFYWTYQAAPGRTAGTVRTDDVNFATTAHHGLAAHDPLASGRPGGLPGRRDLQSRPGIGGITGWRSASQPPRTRPGRPGPG